MRIPFRILLLDLILLTQRFHAPRDLHLPQQLLIRRQHDRESIRHDPHT